VLLESFVISRRIAKTRLERRVMNLTHAALLRAERYGMDVPPGSRIQFVVINQHHEIPLERVILREEIIYGAKGKVDAEFYIQEAHRALWSILAPFGWGDAALEQSNIQSNLNDFVVS